MKKKDITIRFIQPDEIGLVIPIFSLINPSRSKKELTAMLDEMMKQGYQCAIAFYNEKCVGLIGMWILTKFYVGKHIEYDNFYVIPAFRHKGIGNQILELVNHYAKEQGCVAAELTCDMLDDEGKRFWVNLNHIAIGHRYQKSLIS
jgi:GNAT superfamily N-acetyltransferase